MPKVRVWSNSWCFPFKLPDVPPWFKERFLLCRTARFVPRDTLVTRNPFPAADLDLLGPIQARSWGAVSGPGSIRSKLRGAAEAGAKGDAQFFCAVWLLQRRKRALRKASVGSYGKKGFDTTGLGDPIWCNHGPKTSGSTNSAERCGGRQLCLTSALSIGSESHPASRKSTPMQVGYPHGKLIVDHLRKDWQTRSDPNA